MVSRRYAYEVRPLASHVVAHEEIVPPACVVDDEAEQRSCCEALPVFALLDSSVCCQRSGR